MLSPLEGTYLAWLDLRAWGLSTAQMEERHVGKDLFLDEGYIFGPEGNGFVRINLACPEHILRSALGRLAEAYR